MTDQKARAGRPRHSLYRSVLHGFVQMKDSALEGFRSTLGLTMPPSLIEVCRQYYRDEEKRNPTEEEIRTLDRLFVAGQSSMAAARLSGIYCTNEDLLASYRDLLAKQGALSPHQPPVETLWELSQVAARYHRMIGRTFPSLNAPNSLPHPMSDERDSEPHTDGLPLPSGQILSLIPHTTPPDSWGGVKGRRFSLDNNGLLPLLLRVTRGCRIDLSRLPVVDHTWRGVDGIPLLTVLTADLSHYDLLVTTVEALRPFSKEDTDVPVSSFGVATDYGYITLADGNPFFHCPYRFLQQIVSYPHTVSAVCPESSSGLPRVFPVKQVEEDGSERTMVVPLRKGKRMYFAQEIDCNEGAFGETTALCCRLLLTLCAEGADRRQVALSPQWYLPKQFSEAEYGRILAAILGCYRAEIEFAMPAYAPPIRWKDQTGRLRCTVSAPIPKGPSALPSSGDGLYWMPLPIPQTGLPNFEELRLLCDRLTDLANARTTVAISLYWEDAQGALAKLKRGYAWAPASEAEAATWWNSSEACSGILIRSARPIPYRSLGIFTKES